MPQNKSEIRGFITTDTAQHSTTGFIKVLLEFLIFMVMFGQHMPKGKNKRVKDRARHRKSYKCLPKTCKVGLNLWEDKELWSCTSTWTVFEPQSYPTSSWQFDLMWCMLSYRGDAYEIIQSHLFKCVDFIDFTNFLAMHTLWAYIILHYISFKTKPKSWLESWQPKEPYPFWWCLATVPQPDQVVRHSSSVRQVCKRAMNIQVHLLL